MINYLFIGILVTILFDWAMKNMEIPELEFTNWERIFIMVAWPLAVLFALYGFFKRK